VISGVLAVNEGTACVIACSSDRWAGLVADEAHSVRAEGPVILRPYNVRLAGDYPLRKVQVVVAWVHCEDDGDIVFRSGTVNVNPLASVCSEHVMPAHAKGRGGIIEYPFRAALCVLTDVVMQKQYFHHTISCGHACLYARIQ